MVTEIPPKESPKELYSSKLELWVGLKTHSPTLLHYCNISSMRNQDIKT